MTTYKYQKILFLLIASLFALTARAQDEEDFHRLAKSSMDAFETSLKTKKEYYSEAWHGGVYVGNSSRGRILPNGFFKYEKGKWSMTGDVVMDFTSVDTQKDEEGTFTSGAFQITSSNINNRYEHEDLKLRLEYHKNKSNTISLDMFQKFYHNHNEENSIQSGIDDEMQFKESLYEEQDRNVKDFNCGILLEHQHLFAKGGSLSSRVYFKYDHKPMDVTSIQWGEYSDIVTGHEHQLYESSDPKAQVIYLSPVWNNFSFGVREKVGFMNMYIEDSKSRFNYNVDQTLTSFDLSYKPKGFTANLKAGYETYHHDIIDNVLANSSHTYHDWIILATVGCALSPHHTVTANFNHEITRPTYTQLYPYLHVGSNIGSLLIGNTELDPSESNQIQGKYTYKNKTLKLDAYVVHKTINNDITEVSYFDKEALRSVKTWVNDAKYSTLRFAVEGEVKNGPFNMTFGVRAQHINYDGEKVSKDKSWSYSMKIRPKVTLPKDWTLAYVCLYTGREEHLRWYNEAYTYMALRAQKQMGDWALYGFVQDLLREKRVKIYQSKDYVTTTTNDYNARALILGCSYRF